MIGFLVHLFDYFERADEVPFKVKTHLLTIIPSHQSKVCQQSSFVIELLDLTVNVPPPMLPHSFRTISSTAGASVGVSQGKRLGWYSSTQ